MFKPDTINQIAGVAGEFGIEPAALLAIAEVESGGTAFATVDGRSEPLIRFEGHYFDRRLSETERKRARAEGLAAAKAGVVANPAGQAARWKLLGRASAINRKAAYESTSWGLGQVMGAHWAWLGFADVDAMVMQARSGAAGQARLMAGYIAKAGLMSAARALDWHAFARGYNGPDYQRQSYHLKLAASYAKWKKTAPAISASQTALLRGSEGGAVLDLQKALSALGHKLVLDGVYGEATENAVRRFQKENGLSIDGIAGSGTLAAIGQARKSGGRDGGFWQWLGGLLGRVLAIS